VRKNAFARARKITDTEEINQKGHSSKFKEIQKRFWLPLEPVLF
jgi:hypothetical protein